MEGLSLGYPSLKGINPRLIYASVSGFGQHGKHAERPAFDSLLQAAGGLISVTGHGGQPARAGVSVVDFLSGMNALVGILSAVHSRSATVGPSALFTSLIHHL